MIYAEKIPSRSMRRAMRAIPIAEARNLAEQYGYDQVIILARRIGRDGGEHVTTYGRNGTNADIAARMGDFLKHHIMGWPRT
jgi:hypothetical protein